MRDVVKALLIVSLAPIVLSLGLLAYCHRVENPKTYYATVADARRAGAIGDNRWIPALLLPENASDITIQYNIDTNERWLTYSFIGPHSVRMPECTSDSALRIDVIDAPSWWSRAAAEIAEDVEKYRCIDRAELVARDLNDESR